MRKTLIALVAAGTLLVGACGDGGGDDEDAESEETSSTVPEQEGEHAEFCTALLTGVTSGAESGPGLPDIEPPADIAEDYQLMQEAATRMAELDSNAPDFAEQQQAIQEELGGAEAFTEAQSNLQQFVMENCNMPGEGEATPPESTPETTAAE